VREYGVRGESLPLAADAGVSFGGQRQPVTVDAMKDADSPLPPKVGSPSGGNNDGSNCFRASCGLCFHCEADCKPQDDFGGIPLG
jgi:hypothetical protein